MKVSLFGFYERQITTAMIHHILVLIGSVQMMFVLQQLICNLSSPFAI